MKARTVVTSFLNAGAVHGTSPEAAIRCTDFEESMYAQLLCGLVRRNEVVRVGTVFATAFLRAITFLERHWHELCHDIGTAGARYGVLSDPACRHAVNAVVARPDPELADAIAAECSAPSWRGIVRRLWPRAKYIEAIVTGSMAQCVPMLDFYGGGLPLVSMVYGSSESYFGINIRPLDPPDDVAYTLIPNMCYFEFIKVDHDHDTVSGFHNAAPQFRFVRRRNVVLSVDADKTTEDDLHRAVVAAAKRLLEPPLGFVLIDYTAYADASSVPGHYVLFCELTPPAPRNDDVVARVMVACCGAVEEGLDAMYRQLRGRRDIGPLEIRVVSPGAFDALMDARVARGASVSQYKTPRCAARAEDVALLDALVVNRFFSDASLAT
uniref:GH3 C-terminal domain-containing protein n=1 Tax=Leersia perrieri TaxID=77586 RepID=A0A0D9XSM2_9ORYZ